MTDFQSPANARILRSLIAGPNAWRSQRDVVRKTKVSPSQVSEIVRRLVFHRFIEAEGRTLVVHRARLLDFFATLRKTRLAPVVEIDAEVTTTDIRPDGTTAVFGLFTAANLLAPFEFTKTIDVIVPPGKAPGFAAKWKHEGGSVTIRIFEDALSALDKTHTKDGVATSPLQTILDLESVPGGSRFARYLASSIGMRNQLWPST